MRFAIVNHLKTEAQKGFKGVCPNCGAELIPKCGDYKIHHWSHKGNRNCDAWWEPETEWHRAWKDNFPNEWQEVTGKDETTGENHIADVRTLNNLVIEFQHSHIDPEERTSRENFYNNIVWVVDGTRLKYDYPRFFKSRIKFQETDKKGIFKVDYPGDVFPTNWLNSSVPVVFDFKGLQTFEDKNDYRNKLYCLCPIRIRRNAIIAEITPIAFIKSSIDGTWSARIQKFIEELMPPKQELPNKTVELPMQPTNNNSRPRTRTSPWIFHKGKMIKRKRF